MTLVTHSAALPGTGAAVPADPAVVERVLRLLPVHLRARDEAAGGVLAALIGAVAAQLQILEADLEALYDGWFIETCAEWLVPYLADLVGLPELPPDLSGGAGPAPITARALVANTVAYRRRKGTVAVLEQVARDVTGWPAKAVEFYPLLAAGTHVNHVRLDRRATASLRDAAAVELTAPQLAGGSLDRLAHTVEVRRIGSGRGRFGVPAVGVFAFSTQAFPIGTAAPVGIAAVAAGWSMARRSGDGYTADPLGRASPLFAPPAGEPAIEHLAGEENLPLPLRPRRLLALLSAARDGQLSAAELPVQVWIGTEAEPVSPELLRVCGLEELVPSEPGVQVMIDAVGGRLQVYRNGALARPATVLVRHSYGAPAAVGAGSYERSAIHEQVLAVDPFAGGSGIDGQVSVRSDATPSAAELPTPAQALARAEEVWAALPAAAEFGSYLVTVADSASYPGYPTAAQDLAVTVPGGARLVVVAGTWPSGLDAEREPPPLLPVPYALDGVRPHLRGSLTVTGEPGSSVVLDGLVVDGDVVVAAGDLGSLSLSQCTIGGRLLVEGTAQGPNAALQLVVARSQLTAVDAVATVPVVILTDSAVDAAAFPGSVAIRAGGAQLGLEGCTARGSIAARTMDASSCVLDGAVSVEDRQVGCVRYSYLGPDSRTPRRFRCVSNEAEATSPGRPPRPPARPVYTSEDPGSPGYLALARGCPAQIAQGGEFEAEMGVHHHLRRPARIRAALSQLQPYLPVGLEIGMFGS